MKFPKNYVEVANIKTICMGKQNGEGRGNAKFIGRCDFFIFILSLLAMMVPNSSLGNIFK